MVMTSSARRAGVTLCVITFAVIAAVTLPAQSPSIVAPASETFEVASVRENRSGDGQRGMGFQPGGRFRATNMTVRGIVAAAYGAPQPIPLFRVIGGPGWIDSDRFD